MGISHGQIGGGSPLLANFPSSDYPTGVYFPTTGPQGITALSGGSMSANILRLVPFRCSFTHTFDRIAFSHASSINTYKFRMGIYANNARKPSGAPILDAGELTVSDTDVNIIREITISQQLVANTTYWLGIVNDNLSSIYGATGGTIPSFTQLMEFGYGAGTVVTALPLPLYRMAHAYAALPTIGTLTQGLSTELYPILSLRG